MKSTRRAEAKAYAARVWRDLGGDPNVYNALTRDEPTPAPIPEAATGRCQACGILAGPGFVTPALDQAGRCASCARHRERCRRK